MLAGAPPLTEAEKIEAWRLQCFIGMGAPVALSETLARSQADLHEYARLRECGCSPKLAAEILL